MKIKIALIPNQNLTSVQQLTNNLQNATELGEMQTVDTVTEQLLTLISEENSVSLTSECWNHLLKEIRELKTNFKSDYIITKPTLEMIIALGIESLIKEIIPVVKIALQNGCEVIQFPYDEESNDI